MVPSLSEMIGRWTDGLLCDFINHTEKTNSAVVIYVKLNVYSVYSNTQYWVFERPTVWNCAESCIIIMWRCWLWILWPVSPSLLSPEGETPASSQVWRTCCFTRWLKVKKPFLLINSSQWVSPLHLCHSSGLGSSVIFLPRPLQKFLQPFLYNKIIIIFSLFFSVQALKATGLRSGDPRLKECMETLKETLNNTEDGVTLDRHLFKKWVLIGRHCFIIVGVGFSWCPLTSDPFEPVDVLALKEKKSKSLNPDV